MERLNVDSYLMKSEWSTVVGVLPEELQLNKLSNANILVALKTYYVLAEVNPPERNCVVYISQNDSLHEGLDVVHLFKLIQIQAVAWTEF